MVWDLSSAPDRGSPSRSRWEVCEATMLCLSAGQTIFGSRASLARGLSLCLGDDDSKSGLNEGACVRERARVCVCERASLPLVCLSSPFLSLSLLSCSPCPLRSLSDRPASIVAITSWRAACRSPDSPKPSSLIPLCLPLPLQSMPSVCPREEASCSQSVLRLAS